MEVGSRGKRKKKVLRELFDFYDKAKCAAQSHKSNIRSLVARKSAVGLAEVGMSPDLSSHYAGRLSCT